MKFCFPNGGPHTCIYGNEATSLFIRVCVFFFFFLLGPEFHKHPPTLVLTNQIGSGVPRTWMVLWNV